MRFIILGNGYIGKYLQKHLRESSIYPERINSMADVRSALASRPNAVLINCIGFTGRPNVDECESRKEEAFHANVTIPLWIAEVCCEERRLWIHLGSGCIYDGYEKSWDENDSPNFYGSFYSKTKIWCETVIKSSPVSILRIRMPIDGVTERSYIKKVLDYAKTGAKLITPPNSVTFLDDLVRVIERVGELSAIGTFNVVNGGSLSIPRIIELYNLFIDDEFKVTYEELDDFHNRVTARRSNCLLSNKKLLSLGVEIPNAEEKILELFEDWVLAR